MSGKEIDERVVEMRFDNRQFERNVQTSLSTLDKLKRSLRLDGAAKEFEKLERASGNCGMTGLAGAVQTVQARFSALEVVGMTALSNITNAALNTGKRVARALTIDPVKSGFREYETQINAVQTILANTSGKGTTLEQVNKALDELNHYADLTIYNFTEMTRNIGTFTAAGVDLDTSVAAIKGIANLAAVSGSTSQQASTAMYQLSQALASGTVKLMDWNSVVNAGMGGQVFQDALKETARVHGIAIDQMIRDEGSFRETLSRGWLSSDILTETLQKFTGDLTEAQLLEKGYSEKQVAAILEMGKTANDAATKVKTFTQLLDTLKEAAQSGWTETWETIVGDFEEAKGLWTKLSDSLGGMIGASAAARNELLSGALDTGWSRFLGEGIADAVGFKEAIADAARAHGVAIGTIAASSESFEDSLKQGWLTADVLSDALEDLARKTAGLSDAELKGLGYTRAQADELEALNRSVRDGTVDLDEYVKQIGRLSGRENLLQAFWNTWNAFFADTEEQLGVVTAVSRAFRDIFPPTTAERVYALTEGLVKLTEKFKMSGETADKLQRSCKGLFAVLDIVGSLGKTVARTGLDLLGSALGLVNIDVLALTANAGDAVTAFRDWIKAHNVFAKGLGVLADGLKLGAKLAREWVEGFLALPQVQARLTKLQDAFQRGLGAVRDYFGGGLERMAAFLERVQALDDINLDNIGGVLRDFKDNVLNYFLTLGGRFDSFGGMLKAFKERVTVFLTGVRGGFDNLGDALDAMKRHIGGYFSALTGHLDGFLKKIGDFVAALRSKFSENIGLGEILSIGIGAGLILTVKKIGDALETLAGPMGSLGDIAKNFGKVLKSCSNALNAFALQTKSKALINIAKAIAILVGAIAVLTLLDQDKLWSAIGMLGVLAVGLVAVSAALGALEKLGDVKKVSVSFLTIAAALLVLTAALKKLETLDGDKVWGNLGILALLAAGLSAAAIAMSRAAPQLTKGSVFLLAFASSMHILIGAMKKLDGLDLSGTGGSIPLLLAAVAGLVAVSKACGNLRLGSAAGILAIALSLNILAGAFGKIAAMDLSGARGSLDAFAAVFASFAGVMAASRLAGAHAAKAGVGILAMSAALLLLVPAIKGLGKLDPLDMERASATIAKLLLVFAAVTAASKLAGANAAKAGAMLLMMSGALVILSGVMVLLSHLEPDGLDRALGAIVALELVFAALIAVTHLAGDAKSTLTLLAVSVGLLAAALGALSLINPENLGAATAALSMVMAAFALVVASTNLAKKAAASVAVMVLAVGALAAILAGLGALQTENAVPNAAALSLLLVSLASALAIAGKAGTVSKTALGALGAMTLVVAGLGAILGTMSYLNVGASMETASALSLLLAALSGACLILSGVGLTGAAAFVGIGALAALIAAVGGIMAGLGALSANFPQMEEFLDTGLGLLEKIGYGLGSFFGNIAGGLAAGATAGLPEIGANLSAFMESAKPFLDGAKGVDTSAMEGVEAMAGAILALTKADVLNGLTSWLTGGASLTAFGEELKDFGGYFKEYAQSVGGITNVDVVTASANAAKTLAEFASAIPNQGGLLAELAGENSLSVFAQELKEFGPAFAEYAQSVGGISNMDTVTASANAAKSLAEFAAALPNSGGLLAELAGENSLTDFGAELAAFGPSFAVYATAVKDVEMDTVTASAAAAKSLAEFAAALPNSGGLLGLVTGENSIGAFANELKVFGPAFAAYALAVKGISPDTVTASAAAAQSLAALARDLPNSGGLAGFFAGNNDIDQFGTQLAAFGVSFKAYYDSISGISDVGKMEAATAGLRALIDVAKGVGDADGLQSFGSFLAGLAETRLDDFLSAFQNAEGNVRNAGEALGDNLERGLQDGTSGLKQAGADGAQGFIDGLKSKLGAVSGAGAALGETAERSARRALDSHSPSRVFEAIGEDTSDGYALGIGNGTGAVSGAVSGLVASAKDGMNELTGADFDKWLGKTAKAETQAAQETAASAKKSAKGKTEAAKTAYETFVEYIEEERFYNRLTTAEQLEQYKTVLETYNLSAEERKKAAREVYTLENRLLDEGYQASLDWIEEEKYYGRLSLEEELAAWERVQARYQEGTEERKKADREVYRLRNELVKGSYEYSMDWIEREKYFNRMSLSDELAAYLRVQSRYAKGTEEREKMDREVYRLQKEIADAQKQYTEDVQRVQEDAAQRRLDLEQEYADKVKSINDELARDIQAANDEYESALKSRENALFRSYGLFEKVPERKDVSGEELMDNLKGQVQEFGAWQDTLDSLSARGLSDELIKELEDMGPSAISEIKALNSLSDSELEKYADLWSVKHAQAREQAVDELEGLRLETLEHIESLRSESARELDEYRAMWEQEMAQLNDDTDKQLLELKDSFEKTVGLVKKDTEAELREMADTANGLLRQAGWDETGKQIVNGLTGGIGAQRPSFLQALKTLASAGVDAVRKTLGIHSPSRVFGELGNYAGLGFVAALRGYADKSYDAGAEMASAARDGLANSIRLAAEAAENGFDAQPVIRPVLDLTEVRQGAGALDGLLSPRTSAELAYRAGLGVSTQAGTAVTADNGDVVRALRELRGDVAELAGTVGRLKLVLDTGVLVGELAGPMDSALGRRMTQRERGI